MQEKLLEMFKKLLDLESKESEKEDSEDSKDTQKEVEDCPYCKGDGCDMCDDEGEDMPSKDIKKEAVDKGKKEAILVVLGKGK